MFAMVSLIMMPVMFYYSGNETAQLHGSASIFTLGNLGGAQAKCKIDKLKNYIAFTCPSGLKLDYRNITYGLLSKQLDKQTYCMNSEIWHVDANKDKENCTSYLDHDMIRQRLE